MQGAQLDEPLPADTLLPADTPAPADTLVPAGAGHAAGAGRPDAEDTLRRQAGVIARWQALDGGMTREALRHRIRPGGPWQRLLPGVYLAVTGVPTADQRDMAALLHAGPGSALTGPAALRRHGLHAPPTDVVDVLVPSTRRPQSTGFVRVLRTRRMPGQLSLHGEIGYVHVARAVADAVRGATDISKVRTVVADAVQTGRCALAELAGELDQGPIRGSARMREVLSEVADGIRSAPEGELRSLMRRARLPMPMFNARLYAGDSLIAVTACWWQDAGVAAAVDSRDWHLSTDEWERSLARDTRMAGHGIVVLHCTPRQIRNEPDAVTVAIRSALDAGTARPAPPVRCLPAHAWLPAD
jgi:hypothetical protein